MMHGPKTSSYRNFCATLNIFDSDIWLYNK